MKICQVIASRGEGGLEKHVRELSQELVAAGHDVVILGDKDFLATLPEQIQRKPIRCDRNRRNPLLLLQLLRVLRGCDCDIIHAQANKAAALVASLRRWLYCPTVGTVHNIKRNNRPFQRLDHVITVSRQLAQPFEKTRVSVVYNGIDEPRYQQTNLRAELGLPADRPLLFTAGRLVRAKGFDVLLDAVDGLALSLVIAGDGPERAALEQRIAHLGSDTHCRLLGHRADIPTLMAAADAVIISSRREGFSYVFNEAILTGARILATDVPVANEVLPARLIVPTDDAVALRERLKELIENPAAWSALMAVPLAFSRENMTLKAMAEKTVAVYERVRADE